MQLQSQSQTQIMHFSPPLDCKCWYNGFCTSWGFVYFISRSFSSRPCIIPWLSMRNLLWWIIVNRIPLQWWWVISEWEWECNDMIWYDMIWYDMIWYDMIHHFKKSIIYVHACMHAWNAQRFIQYPSTKQVSCSEFFIRFLLCPRFNSKILTVSGLILVAIGQITRSSAMITCGESFNHMIQHSKKKNHVLVKSGIYQYLRHPSYFGFYYWSIGTQLVLGNVLSTILFGVASWFFFHRRIPFEEQTLLKLFPEEYPEYRKSTIIGIPFIKTVDQS